MFYSESRGQSDRSAAYRELWSFRTYSEFQTTQYLLDPIAIKVGVALVLVVSAKAFSFHNRDHRQTSHTIADNIIHNRTVSDFQVKS